ncbi:MAG: Gfo/Idh/MocA family protein, partial [Halanaerobiaceae bacterium]
QAGVVGVGNIGQGAHLPAYDSIQDTQLVAICDTDEQRLKKIAREYDIATEHTYSDYQEMYAQEDLDVVSICTPTWAHCEQTIAALKENIHVLCEKPPAMKTEEVVKMAETAEARDLVFAIGFNNRFRLEAQTLKKHINNGLLGDIYYAKSGWLRRRGNPHGWFTKKELSGGGPLIDCGVHALDLTWWFMGCPQPETVTASTYCKFGNYDVEGIGQYWAMSGNKEGVFDTEDLASAFIKFANGATMVFDVSWALNGKNTGIYSKVHGDKAGANFSPLEFYGEIDNNIVDFKPQLNKDVNAQKEKVVNFVAKIKGEEKLLCPGRQSVALTQIVDAIYESGETGEMVKIEPLPYE